VDVPRSPRNLARELKDLIFSYLDVASVGACTLISRSGGWHLSARFALFRRVVIKDNFRDPVHDLAAFRQYLESGPPPHTIQYTKELVLFGGKDLDTEITSAELGRIISFLPAIAILELKDLWLMVACPSGSSQPNPPPVSLNTIRLHHIYLELQVSLQTMSSQCSLTELLSLFSSIKTLEFESVDFMWHSQLEDGSNKAHTLLLSLARTEGLKLPQDVKGENLTIIQFNAKHFTFLAEFFKSSGFSRHARRLVVTRPTSIAFFSRFLSTMAHSLTHLEIIYGREDEQSLHKYNLSCCHALSKLRLVMSLDYYLIAKSTPSRPHYAGFAEILLHTTIDAPRSLSELTFDFTIRRHTYRAPQIVILRDSKVDWNALDINLSARKALTKVTFVFKTIRILPFFKPDGFPSGLKTLEDEVEEVKKRMPQLHARDMLAFECAETL